MNPSSVAEPDDSYLFGALLGSDGPTVDSDFVDCLLASLGQQAGPRALPSGEAFEPSQGSLPAGLHGSSDQTSSEVDGTLTQAARGPKAKQSNVVLAHNDRREKSKLAQVISLYCRACSVSLHFINSCLHPLTLVAKDARLPAEEVQNEAERAGPG